MVLLPLMRRRLHRRHNGIVALVAMALLPLPMRRRLAVVNDDGEGATGDSIDDNCDSARMSTMLATARRMTTLTKTIVMDNNFNNNDGNDTTGNDNDVDGTARRTTTMMVAMNAIAG